MGISPRQSCADEVAAGRTVPELTAALRHDYSAELQNPRINVVVKSFAPTRIYVGGEVNNPRRVHRCRAESHALAGDCPRRRREGIHQRRVQDIRHPPWAGDAPQFLSVRYQDVMYGGDPAADVRLAPYDLVYVPRNGAEDVYRFFYSYFLRFVPVSWGFSYVLRSTSVDRYQH